MKNKKGFTLIEIIVTITLVAMILLIAVPSSIKFIERGKNQQYKILKDQIISAASKYYIKHKDVTCIELSDLVNDIDDKFVYGYELIDPRNNGPLSKKVTVTNVGTVKYTLEDGVSCP